MARAKRTTRPFPAFESRRLGWHVPGLAGLLAAVCLVQAVGHAQEGDAAPNSSSQSTGHHHAHHAMQLDAAGMVMNENPDQLPRGCPRIADEQTITVRAGGEFAQPGGMSAYDQTEWVFEPCTRLTVTLVNVDDVRHQWMLHGLPRYLYPMGMFTVEVAGPGQRSGTFILPPGDKTYLVHCDVAQHMEKGMKAQLKTGRGDGDLPSIPGRTAPRLRDAYSMSWTGVGTGVAFLVGLAGAVLAGRGLRWF